LCESPDINPCSDGIISIAMKRVGIEIASGNF
jgi:hypothetical protein